MALYILLAAEGIIKAGMLITGVLQEKGTFS